MSRFCILFWVDNSYSEWSQKRLKRIGVINRFIDGTITRATAAGLADGLLQIDASPFDRFGTGEMYPLHGAIDGAAGNPCRFYMCRNECRPGYFEVMRHCVLDAGVPLSLYSDNHTIFRSPKTDKLTAEDLLQGKEANHTQFGRAMNELGINIIYAKSPQAKGRVERMWETLQSRLPVEFALDSIKTKLPGKQMNTYETASSYTTSRNGA